jgi:hypothetical protein
MAKASQEDRAMAAQMLEHWVQGTDSPIRPAGR